VLETFERLDFTRIRTLLAQRCATEGGKRRSRSLAPCRDAASARRRFAETEEARLLREPLPFGMCAPAEELLAKLEKEAYLEPGDFVKLAQALEGIGTIKHRLDAARPERFKLLGQLGDTIVTFEELRMRITATVDEDGVKESASPRLGELRRAIAAERREVIRRLEALVAERPEIFRESAIHFREERLVLAVRRERESELEGVVHGISGGGASVFVEPFETVASNNRLRKLRSQERAEIERVLAALAGAVREKLVDIRASLEVVSELDFIFARADWAERFKAAAVDPAGRNLKLLGVRHPLLELKREVVPLDLELDPSTRVLLISGPNAGGKTVALKTVGLAALMASCGLHLSASSDTSVPFFRRIFIDIGDEQSIEDNLSSFTAHLANLKKILEEADADSLVLLDELGASTSPEEGGALGMAVLETLASKGATVIATTHLESLKYFVEEHPGMRNAGMEFTDHPTYRFIVGIPGTSNALAVAEEADFPSDVLSKAKGYLRPELLEAASLISRLSEKHRKAEALRVELEERLAELQETKERFQRLEAELVERRKRFDAEMLAERRRLLAQTRSRIENLVRRIRETQASRQAILEAKRFIETQEERAEPPKEREPAVSLSPGMRVRSERLRREGVVVEHREPGEVLVEMGRLRMALPASDLTALEVERPLENPAYAHEEVEFDPRLNLRGMRAEEAYERLRAHIAEAAALGLKEVSVLHGKGTGVLMSLVREFARRSPRVASFRVGEPYEGGDGVTVLRLAS